MNRYSAKLLFQFRVTKGGDSGKRRLCEERIITINAPSARDALLKAKRSGRKSQNKYNNDDGNSVRFEFIGVVELLHLGAECAADEVWYDVIERLQPSERRRQFIPPESQLNAIAQEFRGPKRT
jgi:hypothetical protein